MRNKDNNYSATTIIKVVWKFMLLSKYNKTSLLSPDTH